MAGITGIGSGMNINEMVGALVRAETAPKAAQLARLDKASESRLSALGKLQGALGTFQDALKGLNKSSLYDNMRATSSAGDMLEVVAGGRPLAGKYSVEISQLATSSKVATGALSAGFSASAAGTIEVALGAGDQSPVRLDIAEGASLLEVRDQLNEQLKDKGIHVNIINNPANNTSQLVFNSEQTGAGKDVRVTGSGGGEVFASDAGEVLQQAQNARFSLDGLQLESATNTVKDVIPDVEFTLKAKTEENKPVTVTVGEDRGGVKDQLKKFVAAYNELMNTTKDLTRVTAVGEGKAPVTGALVGDATVRSLVNGVRSELSAPGGGGELRALADLGITLGKDGELSIDDKKLDAALESNFAQVGNFLTGEGGLMTRLEGRVSSFAGKDGIIGIRQKSIEAQRSDIAKQQERLTARTAQIEARLFKQFNTMDALVGQLAQTSASLAAALSSLPRIGSGN